MKEIKFEKFEDGDDTSRDKDKDDIFEEEKVNTHLTKSERRDILSKHNKEIGFSQSDRLSKIEKLVEAEKNNEYNIPFKAIVNFEGPILTGRTFTDKWWNIPVVMALLFLLLMMVILITTAKTDRLKYGLDFRANPCGREDLADKSLLYFIHPNINVNFTMCVSNCPNSTGYDMCLYHPDGKTLHYGSNFCYNSIQTKEEGRYCVPVERETKKTVDDWILSTDQIFLRILGDLHYSMT